MFFINPLLFNTLWHYFCFFSLLKCILRKHNRYYFSFFGFFISRLLRPSAKDLLIGYRNSSADKFFNDISLLFLKYFCTATLNSIKFSKDYLLKSIYLDGFPIDKFDQEADNFDAILPTLEDEWYIQFEIEPIYRLVKYWARVIKKEKQETSQNILQILEDPSADFFPWLHTQYRYQPLIMFSYFTFESFKHQTHVRLDVLRQQDEETDRMNMMFKRHMAGYGTRELGLIPWEPPAVTMVVEVSFFDPKKKSS